MAITGLLLIWPHLSVCLISYWKGSRSLVVLLGHVAMLTNQQHWSIDVWVGPAANQTAASLWQVKHKHTPAAVINTHTFSCPYWLMSHLCHNILNSQDYKKGIFFPELYLNNIKPFVENILFQCLHHFNMWYFLTTIICVSYLKLCFSWKQKWKCLNVCAPLLKVTIGSIERANYDLIPWSALINCVKDYFNFGFNLD